MDDKLAFLAGLSAAAALKYACLWRLRDQRQNRFELVGTVKELICYPVKSCKGIYLEEAECTRYGLRVDGVRDRHWMVTRDNLRFLSQRQEPKMALITVKIVGDNIELSAPGMQSLLLPKQMKKTWKNVHKCFVWDCTTQGMDCGDAAGKWISDYLGTPGYRILFHSEELEERNFINETKPWQTSATDTDVSGFADWSSYLFLTSASLEALNKQLKTPVTMKNFRPNIVIDGTDAFEEDCWEEIRIGEDVQLRCLDACASKSFTQKGKTLCMESGTIHNNFSTWSWLLMKDDWEEIRFGDQIQMRCLAACERCIMTTVDSEKGVKNEDGEPLKTLKRIRSIPPYNKFDECVFGINGSPDVCGMVKVGDPVYAIRKQK